MIKLGSSALVTVCGGEVSVDTGPRRWQLITGFWGGARRPGRFWRFNGFLRPILAVGH